MQAGKPIAGFCLGAQILARALGGEVVPGAEKEIGWYDLTLTEAARGRRAPARPIRRRCCPITSTATASRTCRARSNLASSAMTACQLFRYGANVYGFQYHAEVDQPLVEVMCRNNADYMASNGFDAEAIIAESRKHLPAFAEACKGVLNRWLDLVS